MKSTARKTEDVALLVEARCRVGEVALFENAVIPFDVWENLLLSLANPSLLIVVDLALAIDHLALLHLAGNTEQGAIDWWYGLIQTDDSFLASPAWPAPSAISFAKTPRSSLIVVSSSTRASSAAGTWPFSF